MSDQDQNVELARGGLESWAAGDRESVMAVLSDEIEVFVPSELGNAGTYRGPEGFMRWVEGWYEVWSEFEMEVRSTEPIGEHHVVAEVYTRGLGAGSGVEVEQVLGWVLGVRDGNLDYLSLQPDMGSARQTARSREQGAPGAGS